MKSKRITRCLCLSLLIWTTALGQSVSPDSLKFSRRNPDGWFTLRLPSAIGQIERYADVDGGFYLSDSLEIGYDYWTYPNTPNWLRGKYAKSLMLACSASSKNTRTRRTMIDGKSAVIQQCSEEDAGKGLRHIYYVTFPKLKVFNGEKFYWGMFSFTVEYRDRRYSSLAQQIVRSLDFEK